MAELPEQEPEKPLEDMLTNIKLPPYMEPLTNILKEINDMQKRTDKEDLSCTPGKDVQRGDDGLPTNLSDLKHQMSLYKKELNHTKQDILQIRKALGILTDVRSIFLSQVDPMEKDDDGYEERLAESLMEDAETLPLYIGEDNDPPPPLCGAVQVQDGYISKVGDIVAAYVTVKGKDEEDWILSKVNSYLVDNDEYEVCDIDKEGSIYIVTRNNVIPLPSMRAHPVENPEAIYQKNSLVLALYPKTTCFYKAVVHEPPNGPQTPYMVCFEDNSYSGGFSRPDPVPQRYVLAYKSTEYEGNMESNIGSEINSGNEMEETNPSSGSDGEVANKTETESDNDDETDESKTEDESMDKPEEDIANNSKLKVVNKSKTKNLSKNKTEIIVNNRKSVAVDEIGNKIMHENRSEAARNIKTEC